jgi:hypothetical protein
MAKTFKNEAEAVAVLAPLFHAGKIHTYTPVTAFGKTTVKIWMGAGWLKLTNDRFNALVA